MKNVKSGEPVQFTAQDVNSWGKAAEAYRSGKLQGLDTSFSESPSPVVITIHNKTGEFAGLFSVLALGESINLVGTDILKAMPNGFNKPVAFEGQKPAGDSLETVCITLAAANSDTWVPAVILGAVGCVVDVTDTSHRYAVPVGDDVTKLQSSESGVIRLLNPLKEAGEQFCYVLLGGGGAPGAASSTRMRLVQRKELFPACEYKSVQDVYDCTLEYSDDNVNWTIAFFFDITGGRAVHTFITTDPTPHKHWRVNLKGFSQPEDLNDSEADRGFYTFGRLWNVQFWANSGNGGEEPIYTLSEDDAAGELPFDSKPLQRKSAHQRYWTHTFDQPEAITAVILDVDQHIEHYIVCPGGRDADKEDIPFIYAFDLADEKWTALTFPEMQKPMFNMDAKVVELTDKSHQLIVLSGQVASGFSNIIQGYNFEKDYIQNVVDTGNSGLNFAGRPALVGDPMLRSGQVTSRPDGESDFLRSVMVVGGSERSCFIRGTNQAIDSVLFSVQGSTLAIGMPYETSTLNISLSNSGHTGLPFGFFDYRTYASQAGAVGTKLQNLGTFTRHQNLPVRGILRRRPWGNTTQPSNTNPVIDFLLLGGFNIVGREAYNNKIVSGIFNSPTPSAANAAVYSMLISSPHFSANNTNNFLYYPDCDKILGDCCAEYIEERDEIICFGGRANESDTAVAHAVPATLVFDSDSNAAQWNYTKYPPMPNPRWSAASVLIKDLVRQGETESCDRIFIIGGRNREGLVPEVDVFNLRYNEWETEENGYKPWKGLDEGELETYTPADGGGTVVIQNGGGKTIIAGEGITITESGNNLIIEATGLMWG